VALIDVGSAWTTLQIVQQGRAIDTRDHVLGGHQLIETLKQQYAISTEAAISVLRNDLRLAQDYEDVFVSFKKMFVEYIDRALHVFHAGFGSKINHVILAGGGSRIQGLDSCLQAHLGIPVSIANPMDKLFAACDIDPVQLNAESPRLMKALGLALRTLDEL